MTAYIMGRKRIYADRNEKQRAYRLREKLKKTGYAKQKPGRKKRQIQVQEEEFQPELINTTKWSWEKWSLLYMGIELTWFQILCLTYLAMFLRLILNLPRRHGKTIIILRIFIVRKFCETAITKKDINFAYVSANKDNVVDFVSLIAFDLSYNQKILENYGNLFKKIELIEKVIEIEGRKIRQTNVILNLGARKDRFNHSLFGTTVQGGIRGKGYDRVFIDDPYELFHTNRPDTSRKFTSKLMVFIKEKVYPLAEQNVSLIGTRADLDGHDIYSQLAAEMEGKVWKHVTYKAVNVFGKYTVKELTEDEKLNPSHIIIEHPEEWELLSQFIWDIRARKYLDMDPPIECNGLQLVVYMYHTMEARYFQKEYQNNPVAISSEIKWEWFQPYRELPPIRHLVFGIFVDIASGESEEANKTAMVLMGKMKISTAQYFWHKQLCGKWPAIKKYAAIEKFVRDCEDEINALNKKKNAKYIRIPVLIETVRNQQEAYQYLKQKCHDLKVRKRNPKDRGDKIWRISNGIVLSLADGEVHLNEFIAQKKDLKDEVEGFPILHPDLLDAGDQIQYFLAKKSKGIFKT